VNTHNWGKYLTIYQNGEKWEFSIDDLNWEILDGAASFFSPAMSVRIGPLGESYIWITVGDGGDVFSIMLSVVNGQIVYVTDF
jgi:hypothetical protein